MEVKPWYEIGSSIATMLGGIGIAFLFLQHFFNRDVRNLQLMQRCLDGFKDWVKTDDPQINTEYLELVNEELFYMQRRLIDRQISIEWIEGMLDFLVIYGKNGVVLNRYRNQTDLTDLTIWKTKQGFYKRINYFIHSRLPKSFVLPDMDDRNFSTKKRELAKELLKRLRKYKY